VCAGAAWVWPCCQAGSDTGVTALSLCNAEALLTLRDHPQCVCCRRVSRARTQVWLGCKHHAVNHLHGAHRHPLRSSHASGCYVIKPQLLFPADLQQRHRLFAIIPQLLPPAARRQHTRLSAAAAAVLLAAVLLSAIANWRTFQSGPVVVRLLLAPSPAVDWRTQPRRPVRSNPGQYELFRMVAWRTEPRRPVSSNPGQCELFQVVSWRTQPCGPVRSNPGQCELFRLIESLPLQPELSELFQFFARPAVLSSCSCLQLSLALAALACAL